MKLFIKLSIIGFCLCQTISAQTPQELKSWLPNVNGWTIKEEIEIFNPENLFDRINGSAPLFIENNFREMTSMEYLKDNDYITIQAYRHATPEDAFGMYASERSSDLQFIPIGGEAQGDNTNLYFYAGNIYVKMWISSAENNTRTLRTIGRALATKIDPNAGYPAIFKAFPVENKQAYSEAYITSNYIGHEFLKSVYTIKYMEDGQPFQAFVIDAKNKDGAQDVLNKYFTFTKQPLDFNEGYMVIADRYNGNIPVIWKGQYIIGIFSENGNNISNAEEFIKKIARKL